ncbi:MAG: hypothetical protein JSV81_06320 [Anaerolineales bacterium]|nr:MAG: hypothetical protein JSV81_06320 [Anaerolineales bacterium]
MFTPLSLNDPFTLFLFVTATVMMLGFGVGRLTNQRRARQISDWLEPGLRSLGGTPTVQRVSRSAFRVQMLNARKPFQTITTSVVLISREVLPTWLWERLNGRHDLLIVHITFRLPPDLEAEIIDPGNELGRRGESQAQEYNWLRVDLSSHWRLYYGPGTSPSSLKAAADYLAVSPFRPWRVALRRNAPHMLLSMPMPILGQIHSKQLASMLVKLSKLAHTTSGERQL